MIDSDQAIETKPIISYTDIVKNMAADGVISKDAMEDLLAMEAKYNPETQHPLDFLTNQKLPDRRRQGKFLTAHAIGGWLAAKAGLSYFRIDPLDINVIEITDVMSFAFAQSHSILAVKVTDERITIACANPYDKTWVQDLSQVTTKEIRRVYSAPDDIKRYTVEFYALAKSLESSGAGKLRTGMSSLEAMLQMHGVKNPDANDQHIASIADWLLNYAFEQRASGIHIEPRSGKGTVRFRIDGVLHFIHSLPMPVVTALTTRFKTLGKMDALEKKRPQNGRINTLTPDGDEIELKLSTLPTAFGEKLVLCIFDPDILLKTFEELGLDGVEFASWDKMLRRPDGIVLVTGPSSAGKTTTLYASLRMLASPQANVYTIENPIEMIEESFNQMQINPHIGLSFPNAVRAVLHQDPDIIMIGEINDLETAQMAVQAALTGHLVFASMQASDAVSAVTRLIELGIPAYEVNATLIGVMAQRLVRTLCSHCKQKKDMAENAWANLLRPWKMPVPEMNFIEKGCLECRNTGYIGRQGIYEIMTVTKSIRHLLSQGASIDELRRQAMREGMKTMRVSGAKKVAAGLTTIKEVMRVSPESGI